MRQTIKRILKEEINEYNFIHKAKESLGRLLFRSKYNFKPSLSFDKKFGTQISQKYDYPFGLNENKVWRIIDNCRDGSEKNCNIVKKILENLGDYFPYPDYNSLPFEKKVDILQGMSSNFNYDDIVSFSIEGKTGENNEVDDEVNELQNKLNYTIQWVPSKQTIDKIKKHLNLEESIKRILKEETRPLKAMRRTHLIDREIARLLDRVYYDKRICGRYDDANMFLQVVTEAVVENLYFNTFYMMDDTSLEWESSVNFIYDFIKDSYGETLKDYFNNMCNEKVEIDESELTEKCWPGYTQKGMKTMFGKRYPNCVKKTKK